MMAISLKEPVHVYAVPVRNVPVQCFASVLSNPDKPSATENIPLFITDVL